MPDNQAPITDLTKLRREPTKARTDWATIKAILSDSYTCHLAFVDQSGQPFAVPTIHTLLGDDLYVHGSAASRTMRALGGGAKVCLTVTLVDGFVLARSVLNHSINYRCVMVFGDAVLIDEPAEKEAALHAYFESVMPGRWEEVRAPTDKEYAQVMILKIPLETASAKVSAGPPEDEEYDYKLDSWAGVVPIETSLGEPIADPVLRDGIAPAASLEKLRSRWHRSPHADSTKSESL